MLFLSIRYGYRCRFYFTHTSNTHSFIIFYWNTCVAVRFYFHSSITHLENVNHNGFQHKAMFRHDKITAYSICNEDTHTHIHKSPNAYFYLGFFSSLFSQMKYWKFYSSLMSLYRLRSIFVSILPTAISFDLILYISLTLSEPIFVIHWCKFVVEILHTIFFRITLKAMSWMKYHWLCMLYLHSVCVFRLNALSLYKLTASLLSVPLYIPILFMNRWI